MMSITPEQLTQKLHDAGLTSHAAYIVSLLKPSLGITAHPILPDSIPVGASKFGGAPDVPLGFMWPMSDGRALSFVGQINLAEIAPYHIHKYLPKFGLLSFFVEPTRYELSVSDLRGAVIWINDLSNLRRLSQQSLNPIETFASYHISFHFEVTIPNWESSQILARWPMFVPELDAYIKFRVSIHDHFSTQHRMFGYSDPLQMDVPYLTENNYGKVYWEMLLQVDLGSLSRVNQLDRAERLFYCIPAKALANWDFDGGQLISQNT